MHPAVLAIGGLAAVLAGGLIDVLLPGARAVGWAMMAAGAALVLVALALDARRVRAAATSGRGVFGIGTTTKVVLVLGIVVLVNALGAQLHHRFDFTGLAQFTLTSQTRGMLEGLDRPVEAVSFFPMGAPDPVGLYARDLLEEYRSETGQLTVRHVDPTISPDQARRYGVDQVGALLGVVVFEGPAGRRQVFGPQIGGGAEHAFTAAIMEVTGTAQRTAFLVIEGGLEGAFTSARDGLRDNLFRIGALDLAAVEAVPAGADLVILAGPRRELAEREAAMLGAYLDGGGRLMVLADPAPGRRLRALVAGWGLEIGVGHLIDPASHVAPNPDTVLVPRARNAFGLAETYFPGATAILPGDVMPADARLDALVWTSPESWLAAGGPLAGAAAMDPARDRPGPLALGVLLSRPAGEAGETRLVVIGDSDFATDAHFHNAANGELFLSAANWLTSDAEIVSIERRALTTRRLILTPEALRFLHVSSVALLPGLVLAMGAVVWWRRRRG